MVAHYDHPLTYLVHIFLPTFLPAMLFRFHLLTYLLYLVVVSVEETFSYSGYNMLPSALILGGIARRQEKHLMGGGVGNYGCFGLADFIMGTSLGEDLIDDVIDEAEEKHVGKTAQRKVKAVGKKAQKKAPNQKKNDEEEDIEEDDAAEVAEPGRSEKKGNSSRKDVKKRGVDHESEGGDGEGLSERPETY